jgi:hypothetical protein
MKLLSCALALLVAAHLHAADAPREQEDFGQTERMETAPVEVDFSPINMATAQKFNMKFVVTSYDNSRTPMLVMIDGGGIAGDVAHLVKVSLPPGWDVELDGCKLIINSYKGSRIKSVEITLAGEKKEVTPVVKRLRR